jgi:membrane-bound lytic murein transglycosylase B
MLKQLFISLFLGLFTLLTASAAHADSNFVTRTDVQSFINQMASKHQFDRAQLIALFSTVRIRPRVIQNIRVPLEARPWSTYQLVFINESHIRQGVEFWNRNQDALERAEKTYGVPASIIVATIGVETKYGKNKGEYPVIDALASIAFSDSPRAPYFRHELEEFLLLSREQHLDPVTIRGSYAGAIGQPQFMPSSYRHFAVNFSGNNHIDLSNNEYDIIGSIANYYQKHGWKTNQPVAIPTMVQHSRYRFLLKNTPSRMLSQDELEEFGLIKRYNPSNLYAMAVYQLSYYITSLREKLNHA